MEKKMQFVNLLASHKHCGGLDVFGKILFDALGIKNATERESSNHVDGGYLKGSVDGLIFSVSLNDEVSNPDLPYWIQISSDVTSPSSLTHLVEKMIFQIDVTAGFRFARVLNFGKNNSQRIDL
jgi:hypothetical protein